jgi:prepilin peptidase CpaA
MKSVLTGSLVLWSLAIAVFDLRQRRIPNLLTLPAALTGFAWMALSGRCMLGDTWDSGLWAGVFGLAVTVPAYATGKLGAGDAKYLMAIGVLSGWEVTRDTFVIAAAGGVAVATGWWWLHHNPWLRSVLQPFAPVFRALTQDTFKASDQLHMPFGTLLSIGFCAVLLTK